MLNGIIIYDASIQAYRFKTKADVEYGKSIMKALGL